MKPPLHILHVVFSLEAGGMENGLVNVARALDPAEFALHVCCLERGGEFLKRLPVEATVHVCGKPPGFSLPTVGRLRGIIRKINPALVHTHNLGPLVYAVLATRLRAIVPILHGEHGMIGPAERGRYHMWMRHQLYRRCALIHTVSQSLRQHYVDHGFPADRIATVVNGVDSVRFAPADRREARRKIGLPESGVVAGIVGSLQRRKRHRELIEAFNRVAAQVPEAHLLVVGTRGPELGNIQAQITASPFASRIHYFNFQDDPAPFYQAMDLLVVASENEGLSNAALEAMACGTPVMAGSACGNAEVLENGRDGFQVPLETAEGLAEHLLRIFSQPRMLADAGQRAREKVLARFRVEDMARGYADLYRRLAGNA
jgi:glycosyltransferase involved in cell wall biosynthesis